MPLGAFQSLDSPAFPFSIPGRIRWRIFLVCPRNLRSRHCSPWWDMKINYKRYGGGLTPSIPPPPLLPLLIMSFRRKAAPQAFKKECFRTSFRGGNYIAVKIRFWKVRFISFRPSLVRTPHINELDTALAATAPLPFTFGSLEQKRPWHPRRNCE